MNFSFIKSKDQIVVWVSCLLGRYLSVCFLLIPIIFFFFAFAQITNAIWDTPPAFIAYLHEWVMLSLEGTEKYPQLGIVLTYLKLSLVLFIFKSTIFYILEAICKIDLSVFKTKRSLKTGVLIVCSPVLFVQFVFMFEQAVKDGFGLWMIDSVFISFALCLFVTVMYFIYFKINSAAIFMHELYSE